jgi:hypothetical protein
LRVLDGRCRRTKRGFEKCAVAACAGLGRRLWFGRPGGGGGVSVGDPQGRNCKEKGGRRKRCCAVGELKERVRKTRKKQKPINSIVNSKNILNDTAAHTSSALFGTGLGD